MYKTDNDSINLLHQELKYITSNPNYFSWVIEFKKDSKYVWDQTKGKRVENWQYSHLRNINKDIKFHIDRLIRKIINKQNSSSTYKVQWDLSQEENPFFKHNKKHIESLKYSDLLYSGCIETSPLINKKQLQWDELNPNINTGLHLHLYFQNKTNLTPDQFVFEFMSGVIDYSVKEKTDSFINSIQSVTEPKTMLNGIWNQDRFINYHKKQIYSTDSIISNLNLLEKRNPDRTH